MEIIADIYEWRGASGCLVLSIAIVLGVWLLLWAVN